MATMRKSRSSATAVLAISSGLPRSSSRAEARHCISAAAPPTTGRQRHERRRKMTSALHACVLDGGPTLSQVRGVGEQRHDGETGDADERAETRWNLRNWATTIWAVTSKKSTHAEYLQRMLPAPAKWLEDPPAQERRLGRHRQADEPGDRQEVQESQDIEVGLVDRVDLPGDPVGNKASPAEL